MSKFKVGDRVRDISDYHRKVHDLAVSPEGTILRRDDPSGGWVIEWDVNEMGPVNWHDDDLELVDPVSAEEALPVRTVTRLEIVEGRYGHNGNVLVTHSQLDACVFIRFHIDDSGRHYNANDLREMGRIINSLAEALEWKS
jgi:hypothetical protein